MSTPLFSAEAPFVLNVGLRAFLWAQEPPWERTVFVDARNRVTLICDPPGGENRPHWHADFNEWWYVVQGELEWTIAGTAYRARAGDLVFVPALHRHHIRTVGDTPSVRLAVANPPAVHIVQGFSPALEVHE